LFVCLFFAFLFCFFGELVGWVFVVLTDCLFLGGIHSAAHGKNWGSTLEESPVLGVQALLLALGLGVGVVGGGFLILDGSFSYLDRSQPSVLLTVHHH